jgi:hypothetical protein
VQGVGKDAEALSDVGNFESFIEQDLGLGEEVRGELVALTRWRGAEKCGGTVEAEFFCKRASR